MNLNFLFLYLIMAYTSANGQCSVFSVKESLDTLTERYKGLSMNPHDHKLRTIKRLTERGGIRPLLEEYFAKRQNRINWYLFIESYSSGELVSYSCVAYGKSIKHDYIANFEYLEYFNKPKVKVLKCKPNFVLIDIISEITNFDTLPKANYPGHLVVVSFCNGGKWIYRLSSKPTKTILDLMSFK